jgi:hypothetical protein
MIKSKDGIGYIIAGIVSSLSVVLLVFLGSKIGIFGFFVWYLIALLFVVFTSGGAVDKDVFVAPFQTLLFGMIIVVPILIVLGLFDLLPAHWYGGGVEIEAYEDPRRG